MFRLIGLKFQPYNFFLIYGALLVVALAPIWTVAVPPIKDYPNHLARAHILVHAGNSEILRNFYEVRWAVLPNLAMDLIVPPLVHVFPLEVAGKIFISLALALMSSGTSSAPRMSVMVGSIMTCTFWMESFTSRS